MRAVRPFDWSFPWRPTMMERLPAATKAQWLDLEATWRGGQGGWAGQVPDEVTDAHVLPLLGSKNIFLAYQERGTVLRPAL